MMDKNFSMLLAYSVANVNQIISDSDLIVIFDTEVLKVSGILIRLGNIDRVIIKSKKDLAKSFPCLFFVTFQHKRKDISPWISYLGNYCDKI